MPKKRRTEEYEGEEGSPAVRSKKVRKETGTAKKNVDKNNNKDGADSVGKKSKGKKVPGDGDRDGKGEEFWEVGDVLSLSLLSVFALCVLW